MEIQLRIDRYNFEIMRVHLLIHNLIKLFWTFIEEQKGRFEIKEELQKN